MFFVELCAKGDSFMRSSFLLLSVLCLSLLLCAAAGAEGLTPLPMDDCSVGLMPAADAYLSPTEYRDASLSVTIYQDRYANTDCYYAHVKIVHPSQLRAAPAGIVNEPNATFSSQRAWKASQIAKAANAVIALNGDYYTSTEICKVVMRQSKQYRNIANGETDVLAIDSSGDFHVLKNCTKDDYKAYYNEMEGLLYNVFSFGPLLVEDGVSIIPETYRNHAIGSLIFAQRSAIAQLGPLEYMIVCTSGPQSEGSRGLYLYEFAKFCEIAGKRLNENGCILAYNMDGGNSATLVFSEIDPIKGELKMRRVNSADIGERALSDIVYFSTLVP